MEISDLKKVAHLARLQMSEAELKECTSQLQSVFENFQRIQKVNTEGVEPLVTPTDMEVLYREDLVEKFDGISEALDQAPEKMGNLYKVPPVV
ncbi:MAG: Asp-tRNA(Asn)/Glu-tRNA(Gln) amidotransferase subunit GatC [Bdellovibrionales bacterium]|nr:Asp-tRNA(Asn)/Glu-tRNA(Gln) amidotransferase subunit GatC [Bdellovibrionales bacterium]